MQSNRVKELSPLELAAWRGLLRIHAALVHELDRELEATHALPLTHYEVLLYLDVAPNRQLRMSELASSVLLSQSGLTRLVDRLERAASSSVEPCPDDRRGLLASITPAGQGAPRGSAADAPGRDPGALPRAPRRERARARLPQRGSTCGPGITA